MPDAATSLVIRADATARIGAGHVMRCLALATAWRRAHGPVTFWGEVGIPFVQRQLASLGIGATAERPVGADVLVVDNYDEAERAARADDEAFGLRVLVDDLGGAVSQGFAAVWNPGPAADGGVYPGFSGRLLAGETVVPLRAGLPAWTPSGSRARTAAVMLGASHPAAALVAALAATEARVASWRFAGLGGWTPAGWQRLAAEDPWNVAASCACLVTAAGTTMLEAAAVGIPVVVLQTADNQRANAAWARTAGGPEFDATTTAALAALPRWLADALPRARPLPRLRDGAPDVARALAGMAAERVRAGGAA